MVLDLVLARCEPARDAVLRALLPWERAPLRATCRVLRDAVPAAACAPSMDAMARRGTLPWLMRHDAPTPPRVLTPLHVRRAIDADNVDALRWMRACGLSLRLDAPKCYGSGPNYPDASEALIYAASRGSERALLYLREVHGEPTADAWQFRHAMVGGHVALAERLCAELPPKMSLELLGTAARCGAAGDAVVRAVLRRFGPAGCADRALSSGCGAAFAEVHGAPAWRWAKPKLSRIADGGDADAARHWYTDPQVRARYPRWTDDGVVADHAISGACAAPTPRAAEAMLAWIDAMLAAHAPFPDRLYMLTNSDDYATALRNGNAVALRWMRERLGHRPTRTELIDACAAAASAITAAAADGRTGGPAGGHSVGDAVREELRHMPLGPVEGREFCHIAKGGRVAVVEAVLDAMDPVELAALRHDAALYLLEAKLARRHHFDAIRLLERSGLLPPGLQCAIPYQAWMARTSLSAWHALLERGHRAGTSPGRFVSQVHTAHGDDGEWTDMARRMSQQYADQFIVL